MIDKSARKQLAQTLRHFSAGIISWGEFKKRIPNKTKDKGVTEIIDILDESLMDEEDNFKLIGEYKLNYQLKREILRWILFLYSDEEYNWFNKLKTLYLYLLRISFVGLILSLCFLKLNWTGYTGIISFFGLLIGIFLWALHETIISETGKHCFWPFRRKVDYTLSVATPPLLNGDTSRFDNP